MMAILLVVGTIVTTMTTVSSFTTIALSGRLSRATTTPPTLLHSNTSGGGNNILSDLFNAGKTNLMKSMAGEYDRTNVQEQININIQNNPVLMFSFDTCPYCIKAKSILDSKNIKYVYIPYSAFFICYVYNVIFISIYFFRL